MVNSIKNLFLLDYNDTIVLGMERVGYSLLKSFIGEEDYARLNASNVKANNKYEKYIKDDNFALSYEDAKEAWKNFKKSFYVNKIIGKNFFRTIAKFTEIDRFFQKKQDIDYKRYCCDNIIAPFVAMYNVYVTGVRPEDSFKNFVKKQISTSSKDCDNLMIINTGGPELIVKNELEEYMRLNPIKYGYLKYFLQNNLVFGSNTSLSKKDDGRVNTLIEILKDRKYNIDDSTHVVIVGDTEKDLKNYEQFDSMDTRNPRSVYILTNRVDNSEDLRKRALKCSKNAERIRRVSAILNRIGERIRISDTIRNRLDKNENFFKSRKENALEEIETIKKRKSSLAQIELAKRKNKSYKFVKTFDGISM